MFCQGFNVPGDACLNLLDFGDKHVNRVNVFFDKFHVVGLNVEFVAILQVTVVELDATAPASNSRSSGNLSSSIWAWTFWAASSAFAA
jgi:hypothetical protein